MTIYDYMCDVLHIEACIDCPNFRNWECKGDHSHGDRGCLTLLHVTSEDLCSGTHPFIRELRSALNDYLDCLKKQEILSAEEKQVLNLLTGEKRTPI